MIDAAATTPETVAQAATTTLGFANITYWLATFALTALLVWGFRMLSKELQQPVKGAGGQTTMMRMALSEKTVNTPAETKDKVEEGSFSRVAGAIGAVGIAATFVGISYWILHTLFFDISNLTKLEGLGTYFLAGSAMFLPYAFNQVASIFKP
jgi:hypothetical protein